MHENEITNVSAIPATIKDIVQISAWVAAVLVGFFGVFKGLGEFRRSREEREKQRHEMERELRWNRARLSREILTNLFNNLKVRQALEMLDVSGSEYKLPSGQTIAVSYEDLSTFLRVENLILNDGDLFVRGCFDRLFEELQTIEHYLQTELLVIEDVRFPLAYHVKNMQTHWDALEPYLKCFDFRLVIDLMKRFPNAKRD